MITLRQEIERKYVKLLRIATYLASGDNEEAIEILQEGVYRMLENEGRFTPGSNFMGWAFTVMRNARVNRLNKAKVEQKRVLSKDDMSEYPDTKSSAQEQIDIAPLAILSEKHRVVVMLKLEGHGHDRIAEILNVPTGTVHSRSFYAKKKLQEKIKENSNGN